MNSFVFIGERPSNKALKMGVSWEDGRLAAKQLFDALRANGIEPEKQVYINWFETSLGPFIPKTYIENSVMRLLLCGNTLVAMGKRVAKELEVNGIPHLVIVHPAARGKIRKKNRYANHVGKVLK